MMSTSIKVGINIVLKSKVMPVLIQVVITLASIQVRSNFENILAPAVESIRGVSNPTVSTNRMTSKIQVFKADKTLFLLRSSQIISV